MEYTGDSVTDPGRRSGFGDRGRHRPVARLADEHTEGVGRRRGDVHLGPFLRVLGVDDFDEAGLTEVLEVVVHVLGRRLDRPREFGGRSGFLVESGRIGRAVSEASTSITAPASSSATDSASASGSTGSRLGSSELPLGITGTDGPLPHQPTHQGSSGMKGVYILKLDGGRKNLAILYTQ